MCFPVTIPIYYDKLLDVDDDIQYELKEQKAYRKIQSMLNAEENTLVRLSVREKCKQAQAATLKRNKL